MAQISDQTCPILVSAVTSISASEGVSISLSLSQNILQHFRMHCSHANTSQSWSTGGCRKILLSPFCPRDSSDAVELPLPLKSRWYGPAMCQGYLNERGMTVASPDSWQEPGRGGRGESGCFGSISCVYCMYVCMYVCGRDSITRLCMCESERMNETRFAGDVC